MQQNQWGTRWGFLLATIGMAVGTGNIWRFPRVCATNGGGSFIIAWGIALLVWSLPLLMTEMVIGRKTRMGTIGSFREFVGKKYTWMGAWLTFVIIGIMAYYSVVMGWTIKYFILSVTTDLSGDTQAVWDRFTGDGLQVSAFHMASMAIGALIVLRGIQAGVEKTSKILIPSLFVILLVTALRTCTLPGAAPGLHYLFNPDLSDLLNARIWLEAFSQSAWSTGAGWGFLLTYAVYTRQKEDIGLNCFITGFGNNAASILAGLAVIPAIFAFSATPEAAEAIMKSGNNGIAFIFLPKILSTMPGGAFFSPLFFLAMVMAACSTIIAMFECVVTNLTDAGLTRKRAAVLTAVCVGALGIPSALNIRFFENQDFVWGVSLLISGFFMTFAVIRIGVDKVRITMINTEWSDMYIGKWWNFCIYSVPLLVIILFGWWFWQSVTWYPKTWWNPLETFSPATILIQGTVLLVIMLALNRKLGRLFSPSKDKNSMLERS
ncbi:MAG: sodium-dependent transporter [Desulfobacter sp.]|nr:MAG: sodium-dependent transporter [Desulfobacter sp.]